jgi:capsular polysaccharide transport system permease protein
MPSLATSHTPPATHNEAQSASLLESFRIQLRVIGALLMREVLTRFGRHNIGFMWMFVEPMIFTLGVTILWNIIGGSKGSGITITAFVLTGYSTILLWRNVPSRCVMALQPNFSLMFHRSVKPIDVYISRILLEVVGATISFVILTTVFHSIGLVPLPYDYITVWAAWFLLAWFATSLGMLVGALSERSEIVEKLWHPAMYLLIPLSGSLMMASALPPAFRDILLLNPTVHCNEMLRDGFFGPGHEWYFSVGYVVVFNMALTLLALAQVRYVSKTLVLSE